MIRGSAWYVGAPGTGKTSLAWLHLKELVAHDHDPALVVDSLGDSRFRALPLAGDVDGAVRCLWKERCSTRFVSRRDDASDLDSLFGACLEGGRVHLLVDESAFYLNSRRGTFSPLPRLLRSYRHCAVTVQTTTQHFSGDVSQEALACAPELYVFRTHAPRSLETLERNYGIDPELVKALPVARQVPGAVEVKYLRVFGGGEVEEGTAQIPHNA